MPSPAPSAAIPTVSSAMSTFCAMYTKFSMTTKPRPAMAPYTAPSMTASNRASVYAYSRTASSFTDSSIGPTTTKKNTTSPRKPNGRKYGWSTLFSIAANVAVRIESRNVATSSDSGSAVVTSETYTYAARPSAGTAERPRRIAMAGSKTSPSPNDPRIARSPRKATKTTPAFAERVSSQYSATDSPSREVRSSQVATS